MPVGHVGLYEPPGNDPSTGIGYTLISRMLGHRCKVMLDSRNTRWRHPAFREGMDMLTDIASQRRTAIMCSEAV